MKYLALLLFLLFVGIPAQTHASYYEKCSAILAQGIFNSISNSNDFDAKSSFSAYMCSSAYSKHQKDIEHALCDEKNNSVTTSWKGKITILDLLSGGTNNFNRQLFRQRYCRQNKTFNYSRWSSDNCGASQSTRTFSSLTHTLLRVVDQSVVKAWESCVTKNKSTTDLVCYGLEHGSVLTFHVTWNHPYATTLQISRFFHPNLRLLGVKPNRLGKGTHVFAFAREKRSEATVIALNATQQIGDNKLDYSCQYSVPKMACEKPLYSEGVGDVCGVSGALKGTGPQCGVKEWITRLDPKCGSIYKEQRGPVCGAPELYIHKKSPSCGHTDETIHHPERGCGWTNNACLAKGGTIVSCNERKVKIVRYLQLINLYRAWTTCRYYKSCRAPEHGVELYRKCRHHHFGVERHQMCMDPSFGVKSYNTCEHPDFGLVYKNCRHRSFGISKCLDNEK